MMRSKGCLSRWGWLFLKQTQILGRFLFTRHFIEFVFVETKQFVGCNVNVILTRQTCGQRSSMSEGGKRRALAFYFPTRICYMLLVSKYREVSNLDLCTTSVRATQMPLRGGDFRLNVHRKWKYVHISIYVHLKKKRLASKVVGIRPYAVAFCLQVDIEYRSCAQT